MYKRKQKFEGSVSESFFLWGPRQTGKSTLLKALYPDSLWFDLLLTDVFERFQRNLSQLREIIIATQPVKPVVIDEIQKIPALLNFYISEKNITMFWRVVLSAKYFICHNNICNYKSISLDR